MVRKLANGETPKIVTIVGTGTSPNIADGEQMTTVLNEFAQNLINGGHATVVEHNEHVQRNYLAKGVVEDANEHAAKAAKTTVRKANHGT
jgi:hypothetical protein